MKLGESSPPTYQVIVMDVTRNLASVAPLNARREASSRRLTTSSVMGLPTMRDKLKIYTDWAMFGGKDNLKESISQD